MDPLHEFLGQRAKLLAPRAAPLPGPERGSETDRDQPWTRESAARRPGLERAAQRDGDERGTRDRGEQQRPGLRLAPLADPGEAAAFGKDADQLALRQRAQG